MKFILSYYFIGFVMISCNSNSKKSHISDELKKEAIEALRTNLKTQSEWVKVHAAEFLLWSGYPEDVREIYLEEEKLWGNKSPYRIGIWRILSQVATNPEERKKYTSKIIRAFLDPSGADRIHAAETLAKLRISLLTEYPEITRETLNSPVKSLSLYTRWSVAFSSQDSLSNSCEEFFDIATSQKEDATSRMIAAYVIRQSCDLTFAKWDILARTALSEPVGSEVKISLLNAAIRTVPKDTGANDLFQRVYGAFLEFKNAAKKGTRTEIAYGLAEKGNLEDLPVLISFLKNENPLGQDSDDADVRSSAAYAIIKMKVRFP